MTIEITVPLKPPSLNDLRRLHRKPWIATKIVKGMWRPEFRPVLAAQKATGFRRVTFTRTLGPGEQFYDDDNYSGGLKAVRDLLTELGLILDDSPRHALFTYIQIKGLRTGLRITISDALNGSDA